MVRRGTKPKQPIAPVPDERPVFNNKDDPIILSDDDSDQENEQQHHVDEQHQEVNNNNDDKMIATEKRLTSTSIDQTDAGDSILLPLQQRSPIHVIAHRDADDGGIDLDDSNQPDANDNDDGDDDGDGDEEISGQDNDSFDVASDSDTGLLTRYIRTRNKEQQSQSQEAFGNNGKRKKFKNEESTQRKKRSATTSSSPSSPVAGSTSSSMDIDHEEKRRSIVDVEQEGGETVSSSLSSSSWSVGSLPSNDPLSESDSGDESDDIYDISNLSCLHPSFLPPIGRWVVGIPSPQYHRLQRDIRLGHLRPIIKRLRADQRRCTREFHAWKSLIKNRCMREDREMINAAWKRDRHKEQQQSQPYVAIKRNLPLNTITMNNTPSLSGLPSLPVADVQSSFRLQSSPALPTSSVYITVPRAVWGADESKLLFLPWYSDHDDYNVDISLYDDDDDGDDGSGAEVDDAEHESFVRKILARYGTHPAIFAALATILNTTSDKVKKRWEEIRDKESMIPNDHETNDTINNGIASAPLPDVQSLFCRRCYSYDCMLHDNDQPRPRDRRFPRKQDMEQFATKVNQSKDPSSLMLSSPVSRANSPCSSTCYLSSSGSSRLEPIDWSPADEVFFVRLYWIFGNQPCRIAAIMKTQTCAAITHQTNSRKNELMDYHTQQQSLSEMATAAAASTNNIRKVAPSPEVADGQQSPVHCTNLTNRKKGKKRSRKSKKVRPRSRVRHLTHSVGVLTPCDHPGPCSDPASQCICWREGRYCEKWCACPLECESRWSGCSCVAKCLQAYCACFTANRECDRDLCHKTNTGETTKQETTYDHHIHSISSSHTHSSSEQPSPSSSWSSPSSLSSSSSSLSSSLSVSCCPPFKACMNTAFQRGVHVPLLLAPSAIHGFGVFARYPIPRHTLVAEYIGEQITQIEAERRGKHYDKRNQSFLFELNNEYVIDANRKGNKIRYANHSNIPNCYCKIVNVRGQQRIGIFAKRDIVAQEEILLDYGYHRKADGYRPDWFGPPTNEEQEARTGDKRAAKVAAKKH